MPTNNLSARLEALGYKLDVERPRDLSPLALESLVAALAERVFATETQLNKTERALGAAVEKIRKQAKTLNNLTSYLRDAGDSELVYSHVRTLLEQDGHVFERLGPNHADGCDGSVWSYSGDGYNRVRLCICGAEDHAPEHSPPASAQAKCAEPIGAAESDCPVEFAFSDWTRNGDSIYSTEEGMELSMGNFHSGTVFNGTIRLDEDNLADLRNALAVKAMPTFLLFKIGSGSGRVGASGGRG